jgi:hypothetical protein
VRRLSSLERALAPEANKVVGRKVILKSSQRQRKKGMKREILYSKVKKILKICLFEGKKSAGLAKYILFC